MSKFSKLRSLGLAAVTGLGAITGHAAAQSPRPVFMKLGAAAPAPAGYLNFCARMPEQCGLTDTVDAEGRPITADQRSRALNAKYFWNVVFGSSPDSSPSLTPTSGTTAPKSGVGFDWNAHVGASQSSPTAVQPIPTTPELSAELDRVNLRINHAIRYVSDRTLYGDEDYWHLALDPDGPAAGDCKDYVLEKRRALIADGVPATDLSIAIVQTGWNETHAVLLVTTDRGELVLDSLSPWIRPWQDVHYHWTERQAPGQQLSWVKLG